jgi:hypothetical protein
VPTSSVSLANEFGATALPSDDGLFSMDTFGVDKVFYEDLTELWDSDMEPVSTTCFTLATLFRVCSDCGKLGFPFLILLLFAMRSV